MNAYQYETAELRFEAAAPKGSQAAVDLTAVFEKGEKAWRVRGFYAGDGRYALRFLPEEPGEYRYVVSGVVEDRGMLRVSPARAGIHGPVRARGMGFEHADGAPFYPFGTTVYALASQDDALVEQTLQTLAGAPFNKVRMCVFPKHYEYNHNEPPLYAFEKDAAGGWDADRPCFAFWDRFEGIMKRIMALGAEIDLILFHPYDRWGFAALPQKDNLVYLDYLLRRFSAFPGVWWSLANEYDLCAAKTLEDWYEIEAFVAENDPFRHPLSSHNCFCAWDAGRDHVSHASIQSKALTEIPYWRAKWGKPVIIDECCYEGDLPQFWGSISGREMVNRFWRAVTSGGYCTHGETFLSPDDVLWWARGGVLKGESPARIAFLRRLVESLPGPLEPVLTDWQRVSLMSEEELAALAENPPEDARPFVRLALPSIRRMSPRERLMHMTNEHTWAARCGEDAFLWFYDLQSYARQTVVLPEDRRYRVELIDPWAMTRETLMEGASGPVQLALPGRPGLAVLALRA